MLSKAVFQPYCEIRDDFPAQAGLAFQLRRDFAVAICRAYSVDSVVEVGCAEGRITAALACALPGCDILAVDCFGGAVERTWRRISNLQYVAEVRVLDVTKNSLPPCDMLLLLDVLPYLCGEGEVYRQLQSGTYVLFSGWTESYCDRHGYSDNRPIERIIEAVPSFMETLLDIDGGDQLRMQLLRRKGC